MFAKCPIFIPEITQCKEYNLQINTDDTEELGNFFDDDNMKSNVKILVENDIISIMCHDVLYFRGIKHPQLTTAICEKLSPVTE